ncbi:MAG: shikimate kinase [Rhodospirillales bacterium]
MPVYTNVNYVNFSAVYRLERKLSTAPQALFASFRQAERRRSVKSMNKSISPPIGKSIVLIGLMGAGKTCVGKRLARLCNIPFADADDEVVKSAGCSIEDIFELYGEAAFRDGERKVIHRLLDGEPLVLATGGGAFMDPDIRAMIADKGISVWLRAELDVLFRRTQRRGGRPLLNNGDPRATLAALMEKRYPVYQQADIIVDTGDDPADTTTGRVLKGLERNTGNEAAR